MNEQSRPPVQSEPKFLKPDLPKQRWPRGLSGKLLLLTVIFVMIAEVLIFVPSVANFRNVWLQNHLATAEAASIIYLDGSDVMLSDEARGSLLDATRSVAVAVRREGASRLMATRQDMPTVSEHINLDEATAFGSITSAFSMLFMNPDEHYRVFGVMRSGDAIIELVQEASHIQRALWIYSRNVLLLSLAISAITAGLVYLALYYLIVRPIIRLSSNMDHFSRQPENASLVFDPSGRSDEIGLAETRLSALQSDLQNTLRQKQHLADLGLAVSKINHDLRNILASAQLFSDRLTALPDPTVQRFAPKLIRTIDRAVEYTKSVIAYGRALEAPPKRRQLMLHHVVADVGELLGLEANPSVEWTNKVPAEFECAADPEQLFRVLMNLCRNAVQAMAEMEEEATGRLSVTASREASTTRIRVSDTGPGIPEQARENLFKAFQGSTRAGGTGLGMAIAAELVHAHGGTIVIEETSPKGTVILVELPDIVLEIENTINSLG